jgi:predicted sulfurtransferase
VVLMKLKVSIGLLLAVILVAVAAAAQDGPEVDRITVDQLKAKLFAKEPVVLIDTRNETSIVASGHKIKGALQIEAGAIEQHLKEIPRDREIVTYCA